MKSSEQLKFRLILFIIGLGVAWLLMGSTFELQANLGNTSHLGTFEGNTFFQTASSNGIRPGLFLEVMDIKGNLIQYESEEGVIEIPNTQEGAYVTQAKLLGKTKYVDQETGEILDDWEEGRTLQLKSVENPKLLTSNFLKVLGNEEIVEIHKAMGYRNVDAKLSENGEFVLTGNGGWWSPNKVWNLEPQTTYTVVIRGEVTFVNSTYTNGLSNVLRGTIGDVTYVRFTTDETGNFGFLLSFTPNVPVDYAVYYGDITSYVADLYQSSVIESKETLVLSQMEDEVNTLDLVTGIYQEKSKEVILCGDSNEDWTKQPGEYGEIYVAYLFDYAHLWDGKTIQSNELPFFDKMDWSFEKEGIYTYNNGLYVAIKKDRLETPDLAGLKKYLSQQPLRLLLKLNQPTNEIVSLNSSYVFDPPKLAILQVNGSIFQTIASITVPTEALNFSIDPNQEKGQQFIAPELELTNNTRVPLSLTLKSFEQVTDVLNDVAPNHYETWEKLNKEQSKAIALGLKPNSDAAWLTVDDSMVYVVDSKNKELGQIRPQSTVSFSFEARHGQAFSETLSPKYRLTFVFDLLE